MSRDQFTPAGLRARAQQIRHSAQYAQGQCRLDELEEARILDRHADELERSLSEIKK